MSNLERIHAELIKTNFETNNNRRMLEKLYTQTNETKFSADTVRSREIGNAELMPRSVVEELQILKMTAQGDLFDVRVKLQNFMTSENNVFEATHLDLLRKLDIELKRFYLDYSLIISTRQNIYEKKLWSLERSRAAYATLKTPSLEQRINEINQKLDDLRKEFMADTARLTVKYKTQVKTALAKYAQNSDRDISKYEILEIPNQSTYQPVQQSHFVEEQKKLPIKEAMIEPEKILPISPKYEFINDPEMLALVSEANN